MHWSWPRFFLTLLVGLLCALAYHLFLRRKGKRYEEVYDRVVEDTNDESTQLRMLADRHDATLKAHDEERHLLTGQHTAALAGLAASHDSELAAEKAENARLVGVVGKLENSTEEARALQVQITNQKDEYARLELDWKRRLDEAEAKVAATTKRIADADAVRATTVATAEASSADARKKASEAEAKSIEAAKKLADADARAVAAEAKLSTAEAGAAEAASKLAAAESHAVSLMARLSEAEANVTAVEPVSAEHSATSGVVHGLIGATAGAATVLGVDAVGHGGDDDALTVAADVDGSSGTAAGMATSTPTLFSAAATASDTTASTAAPGATVSGQSPVSVGDDLVVIEGIGPKTAEILRAAGITTYAQIRDTDEARLQSILEAGGIHGAASVPTWHKQASLLIAGDLVAFTAYTDHLVAGVEPDADDLTVIEGIGPKLSEVLVAAGLTSFRDVASATEERLQEILAAAGQSSPSTSTWGKQARLLADGDRAGFDAYAEHLVAGRDPNA